MFSFRLLTFLAPLFLPISVSAALLNWQGITEIASGDGEKGPWEQNASRYHYVDDPTVLIDQRGNVAVAWVEQRSKDVFFQRWSPDGGSQLAKAVNVSRNPETFSWLPRIVRAPDAPERIYVLWQEIIFSGGSHGGDILFAYSEDNGATFSKPANVSNSQGGDGKGRISAEVWHNGSHDIAAGPDGTLYLAWTEYDGPLWFSRSADGGRSFSRPQRIAGGDGAKPARGPSLALGKDRMVYLAWTTGEDDGADIHVSKSANGGATFVEPQIVAPSDHYSDAPKLVVGPDNVLHLAYAQSIGGPFAKHRIFYTRSRDGASTFEPPRDISSPFPNSIESARYPYLSVDSHSRVYVVYEVYPDYRKEPRGLGITVSLNGGNNFTAAEVVPKSADPSGGTNGSHQGWLMDKLDVNSDGSIAIVNSSLKKGEQSRVWLIRGQLNPGDARR